MHLSSRLLNAVTAVLESARGKPADVVLRSTLRGHALEPEEKRLVSRSVFAYFRWLGWLDQSKPPRTQIAEAWKLADTFAQNPRAISDADLMAHALPPWVHQVMNLSPDFLRELQREPRLWLRARPGSGEELAQRLPGARRHSAVPDALSYNGPADLFHTAEFRSGQFEIQDLSSQIVGHLCAPRESQTWWDACAGEGGKTLHLCDLMGNKGLVWASDPSQWRLDIFKRRAARAGLFNYRIKAWPQNNQLPTKTKFDGILVDAPCTGIGTWGRNPHARWTTQLSDVDKLACLQSQILGAVASSLKPGAKLIYSICTLTNAETRGVADLFEATHPRLTPEHAPNFLAPDEKAARFEFLPQQVHANGMFVALWCTPR
ncbi:MAG TPA: RsmB/NOP family class I SAM-dependent RNA methyltransferase [Verrucomicrobiae bacterium]|jgi:16S rRNA (cytosine967-C5)-methyltransferase|nr:RsmB/NOP family class I SAM-dependent RNA methyltransferase [Verrucomicrobiae bacterium]